MQGCALRPVCYSERSNDGAQLFANKLLLTHLFGRVPPKQLSVKWLGVIVGVLKIARDMDRAQQVSPVHFLLPVVFDKHVA